jgi:hypothetical protein
MPGDRTSAPFVGPLVIEGLEAARDPRDQEGALRDQASGELSCPKEQVKVERVSLSQKGFYPTVLYLTDGCGQRAVYATGWFGAGDGTPRLFMISKFALGHAPL